MNIRSMLYKAARLLGDANAIAKGKILQRLARRVAFKKAGAFINRVVK